MSNPINITFPYRPVDLYHRSGGRIVEVTSLGHTMNKPDQGFSRDTWHYVCVVRWDDTGKESTHDVAPHALCSNDGRGREEIDALSEAMVEYLLEHGSFHPKGPDGWYAHRPSKKRAPTRRPRRIGCCAPAKWFSTLHGHRCADHVAPGQDLCSELGPPPYGACNYVVEG